MRSTVSVGRSKLRAQIVATSCAEVASRIGVTRQAVAQIDAGYVTPSLRVAVALWRKLGISPEDWLTFSAEESNIC